MRRFGQIGVLKPECIEKYRKLHAAAWPEVIEIIKACNLKNYSIFIMGNKVFSYFEYTGSNYAEDMDKMAADVVTQKWWKHTKPCFLHHHQDEHYVDMDEIFHID